VLKTAFQDPRVEAHFDRYPTAVKQKMLALRELVFAVAAQNEAIGALQETLKWGEPAYLTTLTRSGSTLRMDWKPKAPEQLALYFNCKTGLVDTFRSLFPKDFQFEGHRAIVLTLSEPLRKKELQFCMAAALTYYLKKR
jgi:Domain of unknown function (DU1801)